MGVNDKSVTERVVHSVARRDNSDPLELPPLYNSIDPDVLERGVESISEGNVTFEFAGYTVTVFTDETVEVGDAPANTANNANTAVED